MDKTKWHTKLYYKFLVFLPVILIVSLILLIYFSYIVTYINVLISTPKDTPINSFLFMHTLSPLHAQKKGYALLIITSILIGMLLLCLFRAVFTNPGHFPSPLELENKIIHKNAKKTNIDDSSTQDQSNKINQESDVELDNSSNEETKLKYEYLSNFSNVITNGPLTNQECNQIREKVSEYFPINKTGIDPEYRAYSNEEIFEKNKRKFAEYLEKENLNQNCTDFSQKTSSDSSLLATYTGVDLTKVTLCGICLRIKVERSHHCRQCGRCILKMDHHCPWLANCIGFRNYKSFCLLHFYGVISSFLITFTYWEVILNHHLNYDSNLLLCWYVIFIYSCNFGLMIFLCWLFYVNIHLVFSGQTIIEQSDRERFPSSKSVNIYDMGWKRNFTNIFGRNPTVWLIPFYANLNGNGFIFETNGFKLY